MPSETLELTQQSPGVYDGLYHGHYEVDELSSERPALIQRAFVMPGQGSSFPGMFASELTRLFEFRTIFTLADQLSAFYDLLPISNYILSPGSLPAEKMHIYRNCALFCVEVASAQYLLAKNLKPQATTGHSFGECASLVISGILDFTTMFGVVVHRNLACPPANELGSMIALTGSEEKIKSILAIPGVYLANRNSTKQMVISVAKSAHTEAVQSLRKLRLPHIPLTQLPQPYHSPLMEPYRLKIAERLKTLRLKPARPQFDVYSGVSHSWITADNFQTIDYVDLLSKQITEPVDFVDQITALRERGITSYYEVGPGRMLETSMKAIIGDTSAFVYRSVESALEVFEREKLQPVVKNEKLAESKWFQKIKDVVKSVTGYKDDEIQIDQSFQRDLGIDSIKKAEILFKIINQENVGSNSDFSITRFSTIYQAVEYLEAYSEQVDPLRTEHEPELDLQQLTWAASPSWSHYAIEGRASEFTTVTLPLTTDVFERALTKAKELAKVGKEPLIIIRADESSPKLDDIIENLHRSYAQAADNTSIPKLTLALVDQAGGRHAPLAALLKSIRKEWATLSFISIRSDSADYPTATQVLNDVAFSQSRDVLYKNGERFIRDFVPAQLSMPSARSAQKIVFCGGSTGIAFEILLRLEPVSGDHLLLLGRRSEADPEIASALQQIQSRWTDFKYVQVDVANEDALTAVLKSAIERDGRIDLLVNACGYQVSEAFSKRKTETLAAERASKIKAFESIDSVSCKMNLGRIVHFSSFVAGFGNPGQAIYASSNAEIEARCARAANQIALSWGPWENAGMTTNQGVLQKIRENGISLMTPERGAELAAHVFFAPSDVTLPPVLYAMDPKDVFLMSADRPKAAEQTEILGELQNRFEGVFYKDVDIKKEAFLADHVIVFKNVMPASYFMAQMCHLSRMQFSKPTPLIDVNIQNLSIIENGFASLKMQSFNRAPFDVKVYSILPHCAAKFAPKRTFKTYTADAFSVERALRVRELYGVGSVFDMGPCFQMIQEADVNEQQNVQIHLDLKKVPRLTGDLLFDFHLSLFEAAFQSLTLEMGYRIGKVTLPNLVAAVEFDPEIHVGSKVTIRPRVQSVTDQYCFSDVEFLNEAGEIFGRFEGVRVSLHNRSANHLRFFRFGPEGEVASTAQTAEL